METVDGTTLQAPYTISAIGDPRTMSAALRIPGGVVQTVAGVGGEALVTEQARVDVTSLRPASTPQYARPASGQ